MGHAKYLWGLPELLTVAHIWKPYGDFVEADEFSVFGSETLWNVTCSVLGTALPDPGHADFPGVSRPSIW